MQMTILSACVSLCLVAYRGQEEGVGSLGAGVWNNGSGLPCEF